MRRTSKIRCAQQFKHSKLSVYTFKSIAFRVLIASIRQIEARGVCTLLVAEAKDGNFLICVERSCKQKLAIIMMSHNRGKLTKSLADNCYNLNKKCFSLRGISKIGSYALIWIERFAAQIMQREAVECALALIII